MRAALACFVAVVVAGLLAATVEADRSVHEAWASIGSVVDVDVSLGRHGRVAADVAVLHLAGATDLRTAPGRIIGLRRAITAKGDDGTHEHLTGLIESTVDLEAGESGGPLVDSRGRVIGMNTAAAEGFVFNELLGGHAHAIPIARVLAVVRAVQAGRGSATVHVGPTAWLGVYTAPPSSYGFGYYAGTKGALVVAIAPGSPAMRAGLSEGDGPAWLDEFGQATRAKIRLASEPPE